MPQLTLPIDVIPGYEPRKFYWHQSVDTVVGKKSLTCTGALPSGVDDAVAELIKVAKRLTVENTELKRVNLGFADRIAKQSELLSRRAEMPDEQVKQLAAENEELKRTNQAISARLTGAHEVIAKQSESLGNQAENGVSIVVPVAEAVVVDEPIPAVLPSKHKRNKR